jgi:hypothetical protein
MSSASHIAHDVPVAAVEAAVDGGPGLVTGTASVTGERSAPAATALAAVRESTASEAGSATVTTTTDTARGSGARESVATETESGSTPPVAPAAADIELPPLPVQVSGHCKW